MDGFSPSFFGRRSMELTREEYMETCVNFQPFHTVYHIYIKGYVNGYVSARYTLLNLQGNLIAFMPFAFFLPCFFPKQRHWYLFLPTILLTVCAVEGMQLLLMVGSCDVDDLILNVGGAFLLFWILKIPPLARFCTHLREGFPPREPKEKKTKEKRVKEKKPKEKKPRRREKADRGTA